MPGRGADRVRPRPEPGVPPDEESPRPRAARGSSPPPIPKDAARRPEAPELSAEAEREDDTEYAPPPHAAALEAEVIADGPIGEKDDPTALLDGTPEYSSPASSSSGHPVVDIAIPASRRRRRSRVRRRTAIPRRGGVTGDLRYVAAAIGGVRKSRRELEDARRELERERAARDGELLALARGAVAAIDLDVELVERARDRLARIEERRAHHAGRVAAADEELAATERQRAAELEDLRGRRRRLDAKLATVRERLGPLTRRGAIALQRAGELEAAVEEAQRRVAFEERKLYWIRGEQLAGLVEAGLRDHRAELEAIEQEQHDVAAELDDVEPAIASLQSARADLCDKLETIDRAERELDERADEKRDAVRAARRVDERAVVEADRERDDALRELAEMLAFERPAELSHELSRLDEREMAIATHERRIFEHTELIAGIDRRAIARGVALSLLPVITAILGVLAAL